MKMSLEEEFEKHPFDPECICKLCDWRRDVTEVRAKETVEKIRDLRLPDPDHEPESFRDFHDNMRKYRRRVFVRKDRGAAQRTTPKVKGKGVKRAMKRAKVAILKEGGHAKGDNRKVIWRPTEESNAQADSV